MDILGTKRLNDTPPTKTRQGAGSVESIEGNNTPRLARKKYDLSNEKEHSPLSKRLCEAASNKNAEVEIVISMNEFVNHAALFAEKLISIEEKLKIIFKINNLEELVLFNQFLLFEKLSQACEFLIFHTEEFDLSQIEINCESHESINNFLKKLSEMWYFKEKLKSLKLGVVELEKLPFTVSKLGIETLEFQSVCAQLILSDMECLTTLSLGHLRTQNIAFEELDSLKKIRIKGIEGTFVLPDISIKELTIGNINGVFRLPNALDDLEVCSLGNICCSEFNLPKSLKNLKSFVIGSIKNGGKTNLIVEFPRTLDHLESLVMGPVLSNWCDIRMSQNSPNLKNLTLNLCGFNTCFKFPERSLYHLENLKILEGGIITDNLKKWDKLLTSLENLKTLETTWISDFLRISESNSLVNLQKFTVNCVISPSDFFKAYQPLNNLETIIIERFQLDSGKTHTLKLSSLNLRTLVIHEINNLSAKVYVRNNHSKNVALQLIIPSDTCTNITLKRIGVGVDLEFPDSLNNLKNLSIENLGVNSTLKLPSSMPSLTSFQYGKDERDFREQLPLLFLKYKIMLLQSLPASICGTIFFLIFAWRFLF